MDFGRLAFLQDPASILSSQSIYHHYNQPKLHSEVKQNVQNKPPINMFDNFPPPGRNCSDESSFSFCQVLDSKGNPIDIGSIETVTPKKKEKS